MTEKTPTDIQKQTQKEENLPKNFSYIILFFFAFFFFLITTFPYDLLIEGFLQNYEKKLPEKIKPLLYESLNFDFPSSVILKKVKLGQTSLGSSMLEVDSINLKVGLLPATKGKILVKYKADIYSGKIQGFYSGTPQKGTLKLNAKGLKIEDITSIKQILKLDVSGKLDADINFSTSSLVNETKGKISLIIHEGKAKSVNLKVITTDFTFSEIQGELTLGEGIFSIDKFILVGEPSNIELNGRIMLNANDLKMSVLDISLFFTPSEEFEKNAPFSLLEKTAEGKYKAKLTGTLYQPVLTR